MCSQLLIYTIFSSRIEKVTAMRYKADLLMSFCHSWKPTDKRLECRDFLTNQLLVIAIPEDKTPVEMATDLYNQARKMQRSESVIKLLIEKVKNRLDVLEEVSVALDSVGNYRR